MVSIDTAIKELNTGVVTFNYPTDSGCTTEGEVVILLKRLKQFEETGFEPEDIINIKNKLPYNKTNKKNNTKIRKKEREIT